MVFIRLPDGSKSVGVEATVRITGQRQAKKGLYGEKSAEALYLAIFVPDTRGLLLD